MKIRQGFVSNSSSSSFVIRGIEISKKEFASCLGIEYEEDEEDEELYDKISNKAYKKLGGIVVEDTRDFFDGDPTDTIIVGVSLIDLEDGCVCQLPEPNDDEIKQKLGKVLNKEITYDLHTFIQYIGNDNY
jgi:hypothetical protein